MINTRKNKRVKRAKDPSKVSWMIHGFPRALRDRFFIKARLQGKTGKQLLIETVKKEVTQ